MMLFTTGWGAQSCCIIKTCPQEGQTQSLCFFHLPSAWTLITMHSLIHLAWSRGERSLLGYKSQTQLKRLSTHADTERTSMEFGIWSTWICISSFPTTPPPPSHCVGKSVNVSSFFTWQRELIMPFLVDWVRKRCMEYLRAVPNAQQDVNKWELSPFFFYPSLDTSESSKDQEAHSLQTAAVVSGH